MTPSRPVLLAALAAAVVACGGSGAAGRSSPTPSPSVDPVAVAVAELQAEVAAVGETQDDVQAALTDVLDAVAAVDRTVAGLRDAATIDATVEAWDVTDAAFTSADLAPIRPDLRALAADVDVARQGLADLTVALTGEWEQRYLAAQDSVLVAVRAYAAAADALAQVIEGHWDTYVAVHELTATFVEQRWFFRDAEEAAAAYEVEIGRQRRPLGEAQTLIADYIGRHDAAATDVNAATATAAAAFRERPRDPVGPDGQTRSPDR